MVNFSSDWRDVIKIGVIDCADEENLPLCREYEANQKPTVRYFPPLLREFNFGKNVSKPRENHDPEEWRTEIIQHLDNSETKAFHWPDFSSVTLDTFGAEWKANNSGQLILIVEKEDSYIGRELILDLRDVKNVMVRYSFDRKLSNMKKELPQVYVFKPDNSTKQLDLKNTTRYGVFESVRNYLLGEGYNVTDIIDLHTNPESPPVQVIQSEKQLHLVNKVFMNDLESSVRYSLFQEIASKPNITGKSMDALKNYLQLVKKYFPSNPNVHALIDAVIDGIKERQFITGSDFKDLLMEQSKKSTPLKNQNWVGCKGSVSRYRRYPCSVWMTFHTLSVQAYVNANKSSDSTEVLSTMTDYIANFFGCQECADHFQEMSKTMPGNVTSLADSVLWLWKAHNTVNKRLSGDFSEDPGFPKKQFPVETMCPKCHLGDGSWDEKEVLSYLVKMYTNVDDTVVLPTTTSTTTHTNVNDTAISSTSPTSPIKRSAKWSPWF